VLMSFKRNGELFGQPRITFPAFYRRIYFPKVRLSKMADA
jgi:hypothetical protein